MLDAKNNCWGNNFVQAQDLYPPDSFYVTPTYCPRSGKKSTQVVLQDYQEGLDYFESG